MMFRPKTIINVLIIIFCLGLFCRLSYADNNKEEKKPLIEANAAVDKASILIGDKITYSLTVKAKDNIEVEFPQVLAQSLNGFAIKDFGSSQKGLFARKTFRQWYILDTYAGGQHTIPAQVIKYRAKGQADWQEIGVKEITVEANGLLDAASNRSDIRDIRGPKGLAGKIWPYVLTVLALVLIVAVYYGLSFLRKKKTDSKALPVPAHIIAFEALAELEKKDYIGKGQVKAYYIELSGIARRYLENRFNIRAPEMTTEEFLNKAKLDSALSPEHKSFLRDFLTNCDLVKFAKYRPVETEAGLSLASARKLIDQTKEESRP